MEVETCEQDEFIEEGKLTTHTTIYTTSVNYYRIV